MEIIKVLTEKKMEEKTEKFEEQLKMIAIIKSATSTMEEKEIAYKQVVDFLKKSEEVFSRKLLDETYYVLKFAATIKDDQGVKFLKQKRLYMVGRVADESFKHDKEGYKFITLDLRV